MVLPADATPLIDSVYSHYIIFGCAIFAILWGGLNVLWVSLTTARCVCRCRVAISFTFGVFTQSYIF